MKQSLNYKWKFLPDFKDEYLSSLPNNAKEVNIPHNAFDLPYNYFSEEDYQHVVTYEKRFDQKINKDRRYILRFEGLMVKAHLYFNDIDLGNYISTYFPFEVEITKYIKDKDNRLLVILDSREDKDIPPFGFALDYITFSGIYREVYLLDEPTTYIKNIYVHGDKDGDIDIAYDKDGEEDINIRYELYDEDKLLSSFTDNHYHQDDITLWDIDNPKLYTLKIILNDKDIYESRFGFKTALFTNTGFYLNDKKIKLVGLNRHQGYPIMGYAASKSLQEDDANILKYELGLNVVRTSHYSQSEHFLNQCDKIGLLVVNEIPGWQHIGQGEAWRKNCINNTRRMVLKERNHTALIAHGVRIDESVDDHELYTETNRIAHELDPYKQTIGVRNFTKSELLEDIYGYNDFICDSLNIGLLEPKKVKTNNKPLLVTEYMGHMDPVKPTSDETKRIEVALRHGKAIDDNYKHENACGAIGWCFVDYHSHTDFGSGDKLCPHGVMDLYRNPKYTSYIYASQQDKKPVLKVLSNMKPGDVPEAIFNDIYVATNCDYIELYKNDEFVKRFYPKHDQYKYLKHPPILIDEIVGETFNEDKFPKKAHLKIASMFSYAAMHGFNHMPLKNALYLGYMMLRYKVSYTDLVGYWNKYVGAWGGKAKTYKYVGYMNDKPVIETLIGPSTSFDLKVTPNKTELVNEDTYDTLRVKVEHVDTYGNLMQYSQRIIHISTTGPIELIGPEYQTLLGGQLSIYIKSKQDKGVGKIIIESDEFKKELEISVK